MKAFFFFVLVVVGGGVGLWRLWIAIREEEPGQFVSDRWRRDREKVDAIDANQWNGVVHWPWDGDDAA